MSATGDRSVAGADAPTLALRARAAYRWVAWLFAACVLVQVFLVGMELFEATSDASLHRNFAYLYGWLLPVLLVLAKVGRLSSRMFAGTAVLLVLYAVQTILPALSKAIPVLGPLHAINALALFGLGVFLAQRAARPSAASDRAPRSVG